MNPIVSAILMAVITALLQNCPEARAERILKMFHNPGPLQRIKLEGALRRQLNISPSDWKRKGPDLMAAVYDEGRAVTLEDVQEMLELAKAA